MEILLILVQILFFLCFSILAIYLITAINKVLKSIKNIENDISTLTQKTLPVIENASNTMRRINDLSAGIMNEIGGLLNSIHSLKKITDDIIEFETKIKNKIEEPVLDSISFFTGIVKGIKAFVYKLKS